VLNRSLQDMLLQSWGGKISVFPAVPKAWAEAVFHDLRAEGAFLVSARREGGKTAWVHVKSLAGEPCRVRPGMDGEVKATVAGKPVRLKSLGDGEYELPLAKGQEALLYTGETAPRTVVEPEPADPAACNFWGVKAQAGKAP